MPQSSPAVSRQTNGRRRRLAGTDPAVRQDPVEGLRFRYDHGRKLLADFPVGSAAGEPWPERPQYQTAGALAERAAADGITLAELHSRRRFAFLYTSRDLARLCRDARPLSWSAVRWLLRVEDRGQRERLERQAAQKGWTAADLRAELRRRQSQPHAGGRPPKLPKTLPQGLAAVTEAIALLETLLEHVLTDDKALVRRRSPTSGPAQRRRRELIAAAESAAAALASLRQEIERC